MTNSIGILMSSTNRASILKYYNDRVTLDKFLSDGIMYRGTEAPDYYIKKLQRHFIGIWDGDTPVNILCNFLFNGVRSSQNLEYAKLELLEENYYTINNFLFQNSRYLSN